MMNQSALVKSGSQAPYASCGQSQRQGENKSLQSKRANLLTLLNLRNQLPPSLFASVAQHMQQGDELPRRLAWDGSLKKASFEQLCLNSGQQISASSLMHLLQAESSLAQKVNNFEHQVTAKLRRQVTNPVGAALQSDRVLLPPNQPFKTQEVATRRLSQLRPESKRERARDRILNASDDQFMRMKTVFGHANFREGSSAAVYNCKFACNDQIIITGADDGIIKIWSKDTLGLQASLHGHEDMIIDIQVSKCNRYFASGSNDGTIIFWDLHDCSIITKRTNDHTSQVNSIKFVMVECNTAQSIRYQQTLDAQRKSNEPCTYLPMYQAEPKGGVADSQQSTTHFSAKRSKKKTSQQANASLTKPAQKFYDQFLVTCSDDGSVIVYDISSLLKARYDEFYTNGLANDQKVFTAHSCATDGNAKTDTSDVAAEITELMTFVNGGDELNKDGQEALAGSVLEEKDKVMSSTRKRRRAGSSSQPAANSQPVVDDKKKPGTLFWKVLKPDDFRMGSRNKHIDSVTVCTLTGLVAGGTNHGEIYLWRVNFSAMRQRMSHVEHAEWIGSFKVHKKSIHQLSFSHDGQILLSGSGDGTAKLWRTNFQSVQTNVLDAMDDKKKGCPDRYLDVDFVEDATAGNMIYQFEAEPLQSGKNDMFGDEPQYEYLIDAIEWSCSSRYAFCAISIKKLDQDSQGQAKQFPESSQATTGQARPQANQQLPGAAQNGTNANKDQDKLVRKAALVKVQVYDSQTERILSKDLARDCGYGKEIYNYACVMKAHPLDENLVVASFDGGLCLLYDIGRMQVVQEIVEYGIYSIDQFTMNNQVDVDWSSDGNYLALSSFYGTLSLYSNLPHRKLSYASTRVHQFFSYDNEMHDYNAYERATEQPQLCGYELNPYEIQPDPPIIGRFLSKKLNLSSEEFQRRQIFAIEYATEEEKFIQDQLQDGLRQGYFNSGGPPVIEADPLDVEDNPEDADHSEEDEQNSEQEVQVRQRRPRQQFIGAQALQENNLGFQLPSQSPSVRSRDAIVNAFGDDEMHDGSDEELLGQQRTGKRLRRLRGAGGNDDEDEDEYDENEQNEVSAELRDDDRSASSVAGRAKHAGPLVAKAAMSVADESEDEEEVQVRRKPRVIEDSDLADPSEMGFGYLERARQRAIIEEDDENESQFDDVRASRTRRNSRNQRLQRRRQIVNSGETSQEGHSQMNGRRTRGRVSQRNRNDDDEQSQQSGQRRLSRRRLHTEMARHGTESQNNGGRLTRRQRRLNVGRDPELVPLNGSRRRNQRLNAATGDGVFSSSGDNYYDEDQRNAEYDNDMLDSAVDGESESNFSRRKKASKGKKADANVFKVDTASPDYQIEILITTSSFALDNSEVGDDFSQRGSKSKRAAIVKEGRMPRLSKQDDVAEYDLILHETGSKGCSAPSDGTTERACGFCQRVVDQDKFMGPFVLNEDRNQELEGELTAFEVYNDLLIPVEQGGGMYFHQRCLEVNEYVRYEPASEHKWSRIRTGLRQLRHGRLFTCYRCLAPGATRQCMSCDRSFHGHYCTDMYMLAQDYQNRVFQCIFCRNKTNFDAFHTDVEMARMVQFGGAGKAIEKKRKAIPKQHLLEKSAYTANGKTWYFQPQVGDEVVYLYQGHEKFVQLNNCYFYAGDQEKRGSADLPWMKHGDLKAKPHGTVVCSVTGIENKFATRRNMALIEEYGDCSSEMVQQLQIITYVELKVIDESLPQSDGLTFVVPVFPCDLPQYLVPRGLYEQKLRLMQQLQADAKFIGKRFKTHRGQQLFNQKGFEVRVESVSPIEPDLLPDSPWLTVTVSQVVGLSGGSTSRTRGTRRDLETARVNFWDLVLEGTDASSGLGRLATTFLAPAFDKVEADRLVDAIRIQLEKNEEMNTFFSQRVTDDLAEDYRSYVCQESYLELIMERLKGQYYRSREALLSDIDQIANCSEIYNGPEDELTVKARELMGKLKKDLKNHMSDRKSNENKGKRLLGQSASATKIELPAQDSDDSDADIAVNLDQNTNAEDQELYEQLMSAVVPDYKKPNHFGTRSNPNAQIVEGKNGSISLLIDSGALSQEIRRATIESDELVEIQQATKFGDKLQIGQKRAHNELIDVPSRSSPLSKQEELGTADTKRRKIE